MLRFILLWPFLLFRIVLSHVTQSECVKQLQGTRRGHTIKQASCTICQSSSRTVTYTRRLGTAHSETRAAAHRGHASGNSTPCSEKRSRENLEHPTLGRTACPAPDRDSTNPNTYESSAASVDSASELLVRLPPLGGRYSHTL